jgi:hypothetical protein
MLLRNPRQLSNSGLFPTLVSGIPRPFSAAFRDLDFDKVTHWRCGWMIASFFLPFAASRLGVFASKYARVGQL